MNSPSPRTGYWLSLLGYFSLLTLMTAWITVLSPPERFPIALLLIICVLPLLLPLRGLLHGRPSSANWAAYLSMPYFIHGVMEAAANPAQRWLGILEIICSLWLFFGSGVYLFATKKRA